MPRSSSRGGSRPAARAPAPAQRAPPPPANNHRAPAPAPPAPLAPQQGGGGGMLSGLGATMAQGFAFGTGSAMAREAVGSMFGGKDKGEAPPAPAAPVPQQQQQQQYNSAPCAIDQKAFMECLQQNPNNSSTCDFYYNALQACQSSNRF